MSVVITAFGIFVTHFYVRDHQIEARSV